MQPINMDNFPILRRPKHELINFSQKQSQDIRIIHFAVATTGLLGQDSEICQISAMGEDDETPWSVNILPRGEIQHSASDYNGYTTKIGSDGIKHLFQHGVKVEVCSLSEGLKCFRRYVISKANNSTHTTVLLGWNSQSFHISLLLKQLRKCGLSVKRLEDRGICYGDPYLMIKQTRENFPQLTRVSNLNLPSVYQHLCPDKFFTHFDACNIVVMLKFVMTSLNVSKGYVKDYSFTLSSADKMRKYHVKVRRNLRSMEGKLYTKRRSRVSHARGAITESMAKKIAESGLRYKDLKKVCHRCGREGLERLFTAPLPIREGEHRIKPRVTRSQQVIEGIVNHFERRKSHRI